MPFSIGTRDLAQTAHARQRHDQPPLAKTPQSSTSILQLQSTVGNQRLNRALLQDAAAESPIGAVLRSGGRPLDSSTRRVMEERFQTDFGDVRVHGDAQASASAAAIGARAYTAGRHIVIPAEWGQSNESRLTLAHELAHVVQQSRGRVTGTPIFGGEVQVSDPSDRFEREADDLACRTATAPAPAGLAHRPGPWLGSSDRPARALSKPEATRVDAAPRTLVVQRDAATAPTTPRSAETGAWIDDLVRSMELATELYENPPTPAVDEARIQRQLTGWKDAYSGARKIIETDLDNDASTLARLDQAYAAAVAALIVTAAEKLGQTPHQLYLTNLELIDEAGWPGAAPLPAGGVVKKGQKPIGGPGFQISRKPLAGDLTRFFTTKGGTESTSLPPDVTVRFAENVPEALRRGLTSVAAETVFADVLSVSATTVIAIDTGIRGYDYDAFRFTRLAGPKQSSSIMVEHLGAVGLETVGPRQLEAAQKKFDGHHFVATGWSDSQQKMLLAAINALPDSPLSRVEGIEFKRATVSSTDPKAAGQYSQGDHTITMFDSAFSEALTRYGQPRPGATRFFDFAVAHEIGHALDLAPLRAAGQAGEDIQKSLESEFAEFRDPTTGTYTFPKAKQAQFDKLMARYKAAMTGARAKSGAAWVRNATTGDYEVVDDPQGATGNEFRSAAAKDGKVRITDYSDKSWQEYFAESFAAYVTDPRELQRLRPNLFAYFLRRFPTSAGPAASQPKSK